MEINFPPNSAKKYNCEFCDVNCTKKNDWIRHLATQKHNGNLGNKMETHNSAKEFNCKCGKIYSSNSGLWKHRKTCVAVSKVQVPENHENKVSENHLMHILLKENTDFKNIILDVVKNNTELQKQTHDLHKQMLEVCKNNNTVINNSHNTNSHNKTFNLQVFLNEECKDAMNLTDFMNSFQLQLEDLEKVGTMGYVDGVSNIILKKLRDMDVNKRPMHCSDAKREIMYIKEEDKWEKEGLNNLKLKKAITIIENKNIKLLGAWKEAHPKYMEYDEPDNDIYTHLIIQTMSNCDDFGNKVIKKLAKEVTIDKQ